MMYRLFSVIAVTGYLLMANTLFAFNRQDSLRGGNGNGRSWWDVQHYELGFRLDPATKRISGTTTITFKVTAATRDSMQIDLQAPMELQSAWSKGHQLLSFAREGNVYWINTAGISWTTGSTETLELSFSGKPREAVKPPWDGGLIWTKDSLGKDWISVACQGLGASSWWPCKDSQSDEPDKGMTILINKDTMPVISNGRKKASLDSIIIENLFTQERSLMLQEQWEVHNPINTYDVSFYTGDYTHWTDTFNGINGILDLDFYPLRYHEAQARQQFTQVKQMLQAFEYWFGPYPFYEDGYKIVEAPFLGMEHQGAIAYGNEYKQGYRGKDRSGTGVGLLFDFIIVHESGHEWFGNSITAADIADNWIHEGLTTYSETLFAEYWFGKEKAWEYTRGEWRNIKNDKPVIGIYGVQEEGSGDEYDKGSALIHAIRLTINDDNRFRQLLHDLCRTFHHRQVTSKEMEAFISKSSGLDLQPVFDQYLRDIRIPQLEYSVAAGVLRYRFRNTVPLFSVPVVALVDHVPQRLMPTAAWQKLRLPNKKAAVTIEPGLLIETKLVPDSMHQ